MPSAGSTELWEFDKETMDEAISVHDKLLRSHLREYSGYEVATEGDAFLIAFHEATDAIKWCIAVQKVRQTTVMAVECLSPASAPETNCTARIALAAPSGGFCPV